MIIDSTTSNAIYSNLSAEFHDGFESYKSISEVFTKRVPSTGKDNVYDWFGPSPGFMEWKENTARTIRNVNELDFTVTNIEYDDTIRVGKNKIADNQISQYNEKAFKMGAEAAQKEDKLVFDLFNNAFTTNTTYDSVAWCGATHTAGLKTIANAATTVLTDTSLKAGITAMRSFKSQGDKLSDEVPLNPNPEFILLAPPALEWSAKVLLENERKSDGATNELKGSAQLFVTSWLSSSTAWYLINIGAPMKPVFIQEREKPQFFDLNMGNSDMALMTGSFIYAANFRMAALPTLPWFIYGSTGATT